MIESRLLVVCLPDNPNRMTGEGVVCTHDVQILHHSLGNDEAVEGILVVQRQLRQAVDVSQFN